MIARKVSKPPYPFLNKEFPDDSRHRANGHQIVDGEVKFLQQHQRGDCGHYREKVEATIGQNHLVPEPNRQVEHHADNRRGDAGQRGLQPLVTGHGFDEGRAGEDEEKAGQKGHVGGQQGADYSRRQWAECAGQVPSRQKTGELGHHDQRTGGGFGQTETDQHLLGGEPPVGDGLIGDIAQHGVSAAEGDKGGFGEEQPDLCKGVGASAPHPDGPDWDRPQRKADAKDPCDMAEGWSGVVATG